MLRCMCSSTTTTYCYGGHSNQEYSFLCIWWVLITINTWSPRNTSIIHWSGRARYVVPRALEYWSMFLPFQPPPSLLLCSLYHCIIAAHQLRHYGVSFQYVRMDRNIRVWANKRPLLTLVCLRTVVYVVCCVFSFLFVAFFFFFSYSLFLFLSFLIFA